MKDFTIIGAGYAGISTGALLAKQGFSVEIIESHNLIGGCASYFRKKNFLFDVGATTLSGVLQNQPLGKLFQILGIHPELKKMDIGMKIFLNGKWISRYANWDRWIEEAERCFPNSRQNQRKFWNIVRSIDTDAWDFISNNETLPPTSLKDLIFLAKPSNFMKIHLLPKLFLPLTSLLKQCHIDDPEFYKFLEEQLLITTQSSPGNAPILTSCMGLAYPSETYYPVGGITEPLTLILNKFKELGGSITFKEKVKTISIEKNKVICKTHKGKEFESKYLVSTIPIWNMREMTEGALKRYYEKFSKKFPEGPGAFTIYFGIKPDSPIDGGYYQIHTDKHIPHCEAGAFFMTMSESGDTKKAPEGYRTVTISTHTNANSWRELRGSEYSVHKEEITNYILNELGKAIPGIESSEKFFLLSGSPKTFERYTGRESGYVGGIPHKVTPSLLFLPPNRTKFKGIFQGGDTAFPGQGTPAVVQGAIQIMGQAIKL